MAKVTARAFWGPRQQPVDDAVATIVAMLSGLRELDAQHFGQWFDLGKSPADMVRRQITVDEPGVRAFVKDGGDDLGCSFFAWNGLPDADALGVNCSFSTTSPLLKNRVVIDLPVSWERDLDRARQALDLVIRLWRPERANVWNGDHVDLVVAAL